jgi:ribosomal protein L37AE/L43A
MKMKYRKYPFEMEEVIWACQPCHQVVEGMGHESQLAIHRKKIKARRVPVEPIFKR